jgi:murein DD-endopeptidase / murein LD-carboxypeptidase
MNSIRFCAIFVFGLLISSCSISKKSLITELEESKKKNEVLNVENQKLLNKINNLEITLKDSKQKNETIVIINPTIDIPNKPTQIVSQLKDFEKVISSNHSLSTKFNSFKKGGIEKYINVSSSEMEKVILEAKTYLGTRHVMGGLSHSGIDCSGLLYVSFQKNGIKGVPRIAQDFARLGNIMINVNKLRKGDLIFFTNTYRTSKLVTHAGICIGNGEFIHTSSSKGVMISKINDPYYWRDKFLFGTRIVN